jgi:transposase InsO family protein
MTATHKGDMFFETQVNGMKNKITICNILLVPDLDVNLMSVAKLDQNGYQVKFKKGEVHVQKDGNTVAIGKRNGRMYDLKGRKLESQANLSEVKTETIWHKRLGHVSTAGLQKLKGMVNGFSENAVKENICSVCVEGKQCKLPHSQPRWRATRPLQLVRSDLCGPVTAESYDKKRYVITFIDDFTHFTFVYLLQEKSEAFQCFKNYKAMATAHFNNKLSRFHCDNGEEYVSKEMTNYFKEKGIQVEFTIRYMPQQNGVAERLNRTIMEKACCMQLNSGLGKSLWTEAVMAAVYVINRCPTTALKDCVPAEL